MSTSPSSQIVGAARQDQRAGLVVDEGAAAGGDHLARALDQPRHHPPLAVAEMGLAEPLENLGDAEARGRLDLGIGVGEGQREAFRQPPADAGLARAHQADERDRLFWLAGRVRHEAGAIQAASRWGKRPAMPRTSFPPQRRRRSPVGMILLLIVAAFIGFLIYLGVRSDEVPVQRIEQDVTNAVRAR